MKQSLCTLADVPEHGTRKVDFFGREALVYRHGGDVKAALSVCPHLGGPLELMGAELVCPWHGARFDAGSGTCQRGPADAASKAMFLPTRVDDGTLTHIWGE